MGLSKSLSRRDWAGGSVRTSALGVEAEKPVVEGVVEGEDVW